MRRKHKRMELVRPADRRGRREPNRPADEIFLTRRMFIFKGLAVAGFGALVARLGKMQLADAEMYEIRAEGNTINTVTIPAPRGLIVDRNGAVLAENRVSWTVTIVPSQLPEDEARWQYIRSQLIAALGLADQLTVRRNGLPLGTEDSVLQALASALGSDPAELTRTVRDAPDNLIIVKKDLSPEETQRFQQVAKELPGVQVMNLIDYLVELNAGAAVPITVKEDVPRDVALSLEANGFYLPGVRVSDETLIRQYPAGPEFSHILGYVGPITAEEYAAAGGNSPENPYRTSDAVGRGGIEEAMEEILRGTHGVRWVQTDARGVEVSEIRERRLDPTPGATIELTIDQELQRAVTAALSDGIKMANADAMRQQKEPVGSGVAIALNPQNGEILAMVSLPTFDNQRFIGGISQQDYDAYLNDPFKPLTNFAVSGIFPPGSTIKPLYAAAALQEGTITENTEYYCAGQIRVPTVNDETGGNTYVCWQPAGHGSVDVRTGIAESCDIFFYNVGAPNQTAEGSDQPLHYYNPGDAQPHYFEGLGIERIEKYLRNDFGFGAVTGIELAGEEAGIVPNQRWLLQNLREYWSVGDTINVSIGQGHLSCTPLQLVTAIAAIANGGVLYRPRLVRALRDAAGQVTQEIPPEEHARLSVSQENVQIVREGMRQTITDGTAKGKFTRTGNDIAIAGKTGTAEFGEAVNGKYKMQHAWFTAFAPYERPEIAVVVLIQGGGEGSTFAVPVADAILAAYFERTNAAAA